MGLFIQKRSLPETDWAQNPDFTAISVSASLYFGYDAQQIFTPPENPEKWP